MRIMRYFLINLNCRMLKKSFFRNGEWRKILIIYFEECVDNHIQFVLDYKLFINLDFKLVYFILKGSKIL